MSDLFSNLQMADLSPEEQAKKALLHLVQQLRTNPKLYKQMGLGSQTFALVTEAAAALFEEADIKKLRESIVHDVVCIGG